MLPVVAAPAVVARKILVYSYVMVAVTLGLAPYAGWLYTACALGLGGWFLAEAHRLHARVAAMPDAAHQPVPVAVPPAGSPAGRAACRPRPAGRRPQPTRPGDRGRVRWAGPP